MARFLILISLLSAIVGCSESSDNVEASGTVTLDGAPVAKAQVIFIDEASQNPGSATTDDDGHFSLKLNGEKEGVLPGNYKVQVSKTILESKGEGGAEVNISHGLPKKYASFVTSGLTYSVPEAGASDIKIELTSK